MSKQQPRIWMFLAVGLVLGFLLGALFGGGKIKSPAATSTKAVASKDTIQWNTPDEDKWVAYVLPNDGPYYDLKWEGIQSELRALGYKATRYSAGSYSNINEQLQIMDNVIEKGVSGIILHAINHKTLAPTVEKAYTRGIPVIAENVKIDSPYLAGSVQLANFENGYQLAMALVEDLGGEGKIVALVGPAGLEASDEMWRGAKSYFDRWPKIEILHEKYLPAKVPEALQLTEDLLATEPDITGVYTWYVQNGVGAAQAVKAMGHEAGEIKIVAKDINPTGEELLRQGYISSLLVGEPINMGRRSARLLDGILRREKEATGNEILLRNLLVSVDSLGQVDRSGFDKDTQGL